MSTAILIAVEPIAITNSMLVSSSVPETDEAWSKDKTYAVGARVRHPTTNRLYESGKATNLNHDPNLPENTAGTTPWWIDLDTVTNRMLMFDSEVNTQTVGDSPMSVVLRPGFASDFYFAGLDADFLTLTVRDKPGGAVIFQKVQELESSAPGDYDEYFWGDFKPMTDLFIGDVDPYFNCEVTVTLTKASGQVKCGLMAVGARVECGRTLAEAQVTPRTFAYIKTDDFGKTKIKRRNKATDMELTALVDRSEASTVLDAIQRLQDVPCAWIASSTPEYAGLRGFGLGSGTLTYNGSDRVTLRFKLQGFI